jgi:hypothetical protein
VFIVSIFALIYILYRLHNSKFIKKGDLITMGKEIKTIATVVAIGAQLSTANATQSTVQDLYQLGVNPDYVISAFHESIDIKLNPNEALKVTYEDEGKNIRFETLDNFSLVVPIDDAIGIGNKMEPRS